jgi:hypothetical protein
VTGKGSLAQSAGSEKERVEVRTVAGCEGAEDSAAVSI